MEAFAFQHSPYLAAVKEEREKGTIGDVPAVTEAFSMANARTIDRILEAVGY